MSRLEDLLQRLLDHDVEFAVIGGFSAVAQGVPLLTLDVDICCPFETDNLLRLEKALEGLHAYHRLTPKKLPLDFTVTSPKGLKNLYLMTDAGQLDCLSTVKGIGGYEEVRASSELLPFRRTTCRFLSVDGLIAAKEAIKRPKDEQALVLLRAVRERTKKTRKP